MRDEDISYHISALNQPHLIEGLEQLSLSEKHAFLRQLQLYTPELLKQQRSCLNQLKMPLENVEPWGDVLEKVQEDDVQAGERALFEGKVGCLILAGGMGSRLGKNQPKGTISVSAVQKKSLFQLFFERVDAVQKKYNRKLPLAIMTSSLNHDDTVAFLEEHDWFGLEKDQIDFFIQEELPLCDEQENWFLTSPGKIATGPNGNGNSLRLFYDLGLWEKWRQKGIEHLHVIQVDNALADPFDQDFLGFHVRKGCEGSIHCTYREHAQEKVGLLVSKQGKCSIIEYSEISKHLQDDPVFRFANIGLFCFSFPFIEKHAKHVRLPWHIAEKKAKVWGKTEEIRVAKFETFLFDAFEQIDRTAVFASPRDICYAALKNAVGEKSIKTVTESLIRADRKLYFEIAGCAPPEEVLELHPAFYYGSDKQRKIWKGKKWPLLSYIDPSCL